MATQERNVQYAAKRGLDRISKKWVGLVSGGKTMMTKPLPNHQFAQKTPAPPPASKENYRSCPVLSLSILAQETEHKVYNQKSHSRISIDNNIKVTIAKEMNKCLMKNVLSYTNALKS